MRLEVLCLILFIYGSLGVTYDFSKMKEGNSRQSKLIECHSSSNEASKIGSSIQSIGTILFIAATAGEGLGLIEAATRAKSLFQSVASTGGLVGGLLAQKSDDQTCIVSALNQLHKDMLNLEQQMTELGKKVDKDSAINRMNPQVKEIKNAVQKFYDIFINNETNNEYVNATFLSYGEGQPQKQLAETINTLYRNMVTDPFLAQGLLDAIYESTHGHLRMLTLVGLSVANLNYHGRLTLSSATLAQCMNVTPVNETHCKKLSNKIFQYDFDQTEGPFWEEMIRISQKCIDEVKQNVIQDLGGQTTTILNETYDPQKQGGKTATMNLYTYAADKYPWLAFYSVSSPPSLQLTYIFCEDLGHGESCETRNCENLCGYGWCNFYFENENHNHLIFQQKNGENPTNVFLIWGTLTKNNAWEQNYIQDYDKLVSTAWSSVNKLGWAHVGINNPSLCPTSDSTSSIHTWLAWVIISKMNWPELSDNQTKIGYFAVAKKHEDKFWINGKDGGGTQTSYTDGFLHNSISMDIPEFSTYNPNAQDISLSIVSLFNFVANKTVTTTSTNYKERRRNTDVRM
jgi:hypothetical protein